MPCSNWRRMVKSTIRWFSIAFVVFLTFDFRSKLSYICSGKVAVIHSVLKVFLKINLMYLFSCTDPYYQLWWLKRASGDMTRMTLKWQLLSKLRQIYFLYWVSDMSCKHKKSEQCSYFYSPMPHIGYSFRVMNREPLKHIILPLVSNADISAQNILILSSQCSTLYGYLTKSKLFFLNLCTSHRCS